MKHSHDFAFPGGKAFKRMGASWFVSYGYYKYVDSSHMNWEGVMENARTTRISVYRNNKNMHKYWLLEVLTMNERKMNTNSLGLTGMEIKQMAKKIIAKLD